MVKIVQLWVVSEKILSRTEITWRWEKRGKRETTPNATLSPMSSDESHYHASLIVRDMVTRQSPETTTFEETKAEAESKRGPSANQPITPYR